MVALSFFAYPACLIVLKLSATKAGAVSLILSLVAAPAFFISLIARSAPLLLPFDE